MNFKARLEDLAVKLKEQEANAPIMGMGEFIPACRREVAQIVGARLCKDMDPKPIPIDKVRLLMDNNDMKKPMALFDAPGVVLQKYLCTINPERTGLHVKTLLPGCEYTAEYHRQGIGGDKQ